MLHPIVAQTAPSPEQLPAIEARGRDVVVVAGAGAGKTRTLVARYLSLLAEDAPLRSVVAITFTKKAAREMRNRVRDEMRRYLQQPGLPETERQRWQRLYAELDAARISTIHGLCTEILRSHPAESALDPRFTVLEEGQAAILQRRSVEQALAWAANDAQAAALFALLTETGLRSALDDLLRRRLDAAPCLSGLPEPLWPAWERLLGPAAGDLVHDRRLAEAMPAVQRLFAQVTQVYQLMKDQAQAVDFDDLENLAVSLLATGAGARSRWQAEVKALLVDEYQDTNGRQRDLVNCISGGGGHLFIVGDAKQSIYRFRGADVTVFRQEREQIDLQGGLVVPLETSYRAHRQLVSALNTLLQPVLGTEAPADRPWVEPFSRLTAYRQQASPGFSPPHVELHLAQGTKGSGALDRAARALAQRLHSLVTVDKPQVPEGGAYRPLAYSDIAILCRASGSFEAYEDALEEAGLPFVTVAGQGFYGRPEVRDLLNALRALADPTDDLALAGLLRSPALALSDHALYRLCQARGRPESHLSLWEVLQAGAAGLVGEDKAAAERAAGIIDSLHQAAGRTTVADLLDSFLQRTDYRAALIAAGQSRGARNVAKLLADAHASGLVGVGEFLEYVDGLRDAGTREGEAATVAEGSVQIMSVHAAKGLEFPVVVIGDVTYSHRPHRPVLMAPCLGVFPPLKDESGERPAMYALRQRLEDDQEEAEAQRLLYVAATRAQEMLILSGAVKPTKRGELGTSAGWLHELSRGMQRTAIPQDIGGPQAVPLQWQAGDVPVACFVYGSAWQPTARAAPEEASPPLPVTLPPPLLDPVSLAAAGGPALQRKQRLPERVWRVVPAVKRPRVPAWVVGSVVHEALAAWRFPDLGFADWARSRAREYGVTDPDQLADAVGQSQRLLLRLRAHPLWAEIDGAERRLHEVPYSLPADGRADSGLIDCLYLRDGTWTIVEFKTDEIRDQATLDALLTDDYLAQAQRYALAVQRLLGRRPRLVLCLLNYERAVRVLRDLPLTA